MSMQAMIENKDAGEIVKWDGEQDAVRDVCCQRRDFALNADVEFFIGMDCFEGQISGPDDHRELWGSAIGQSVAGGVETRNGQKGKFLDVGHGGGVDGE